MKWKGILIGGCALVGLMFMSQSAVSAQTPSLLEQAEKLIGTPYHKGGTDPKTGFDASGFIQYVYKTSETFDLPRKVIDQYQIGKRYLGIKRSPVTLCISEALKKQRISQHMWRCTLGTIRSSTSRLVKVW